jgi:signal peptidase I
MNGAQGRQDPDRSDVTFACSRCGARFGNRWRLRAHLPEHGIYPSPEWRQSQGPVARVRPVPAELCARPREHLPQKIAAPAAATSGELRRIRSSGRLGRAILAWTLTALLAVGCAWLVQAYVVKSYRIPSNSMANTLAPHQRVLVDRLIYRFRPVQLGDIIVFRCAALGNEVLIKRVVGLPGDLLALRDGQLYVNGVQASDSFVDKVDGVVEPTRPAHSSMGNDPSAPWSLAQPYRVPVGHYFVMGDNRTDSDDSRYWGTVPSSAIIGQAFFTYWPLGRIGSL